MDVSLISERYAKALFDYAEDLGKSDVLYEEMGLVSECYFSMKEFATALRNPMVTMQQREQLLITAAGGNVSDIFIKFKDLVIAHQRIDCFHLMALKYCDLYRSKHNIHYCKLTTAIAMDEDEIKRIKQDIGCYIADNSEIEIHDEVDADIIGGFVFEMDSKLLDSSIASQLRTVKNELVDKRKRLN